MSTLDITVGEALRRARDEGDGWIYIHDDDGHIAAILLTPERADREILDIDDESPPERWAHTHYDREDI
jgi:hypothetical protein